MVCRECTKDFSDRSHLRGGISIFVAGDEYIYSYWLCPRCDHYTVESYRDRFMGDAVISTLGPFERALGDRAVSLIATCPSPGNKHCDCAAHRALYYGTPREP